VEKVKLLTLIKKKNKMANSKLIITFNKEAEDNNNLGFYVVNYGEYKDVNIGPSTILKTFKSVANPLDDNEIQIFAPTSNKGESSAIGFASSLYSETGLLVSVDLNVVTIEINNEEKYFLFSVEQIWQSVSLYYNQLTGYNDYISWQAKNISPDDLILDSLTFEEASNLKCKKVKTTISTNKLDDIIFDSFRNTIENKKIIYTIPKLTNQQVRFHNLIDSYYRELNFITFSEYLYKEFMVSGNVFTIENCSVLSNNKKYTILRCDIAQWESGVYNYTLTVAEKVVEVGFEYLSIDYSKEINLEIKPPSVLTFDNLTISQLQLLNGKINVSILKKIPIDFYVYYSIDDINWQQSNAFEDLSLGKKTFYVKDNFGCKISSDFLIENINDNAKIKSCFSYISNSMSIRFKKEEQFDYLSIFKNDSNTLSFEEDVNIPYGYTQKFNTSNFVTTQILTNYENTYVNIIKCDGSKDVIQLENKINFLNLKDKRDCEIFNIDINKTGIIFKKGYLYNYEDNSIIDTYELDGVLPEYAIVGNNIFLENIGWFKISELIYDEVKNCNVIVIDNYYSGNLTASIISCKYNLENYNVKEFFIDFSKYVNQNIQVEIKQSSIGFDDYNYLSEPICVYEKLDKHIEIKWSNSFDTDVYYSTGISNVGNFEFEHFKTIQESEVTINKGINSSVMINSSNYDKKELSINDLSTGIAKKLSQALLHKDVYVNNKKFLITEAPSIENIQGTNIYKIVAGLLSINKDYITQTNYNNQQIALNINSYSI